MVYGLNSLVLEGDVDPQLTEVEVDCNVSFGKVLIYI